MLIEYPSEANFDQLIPDKSTFGTDGTGKQITFDDWKKANPKLIGQFYGFMAEWTSDLGDKGLSTLGVKVTIPSMDDRKFINVLSFPQSTLMGVDR